MRLSILSPMLYLMWKKTKQLITVCLRFERLKKKTDFPILEDAIVFHNGVA